MVLEPTTTIPVEMLFPRAPDRWRKAGSDAGLRPAAAGHGSCAAARRRMAARNQTLGERMFCADIPESPIN
jgi:hypothetical protein